MRVASVDEPTIPDNGADKDHGLVDFRAKAAQCRRLAAGVCDHQAAEVLRAMADTYELGAQLRS